jgi:hypothetical protein
MPFEVRDGITLASARAALADPFEALRDCVANSAVPNEKLLNDLAVGIKGLYEFAGKLEEDFHKYVDLHAPEEGQLIIKLESTDGASQERLTEMMRHVQQALRAEVVRAEVVRAEMVRAEMVRASRARAEMVQDVNQARRYTRQRLREEREREAAREA